MHRICVSSQRHCFIAGLGISLAYEHRTPAPPALQGRGAPALCCPRPFGYRLGGSHTPALGGLCEAETCPGGVIPEDWLSQQHLGLLLLSQAFPLNTSVGRRGVE